MKNQIRLLVHAFGTRFRGYPGALAVLITVFLAQPAGAIDINTSSTFSGNARWNEIVNVSTTGSTGSVTQTAGLVEILYTLNVGVNFRGSYLLSGGTLWTNDALNLAPNAGGTGSTFTQTGGTATFSNGGRLGNSTIYNISGGKVTFRDLNMTAGSNGQVIQTGGHVNVLYDGPSVPGRVFIGNNAAYLMTSGTFTGQLVYFNAQSGTMSFKGGSVGISQRVAFSNGAGTKQFIVGDNLTPASIGSLQDDYTFGRVLLGNTAGGTALVIGTDGSSASYHGLIQDLDATHTGGFEKVGGGTIFLTGANTYSGGTVISGGWVQFSSTSNFGSGKITLNGGGLYWEGNNQDISAKLNPLGANGGSFYNPGGDATLASVISGSGGFRKVGDGTIRLTALNTYTGGTVVEGGTLMLMANSGGVGTIRGNLTATDSTIISGVSNSIGYGANGAKVDNVSLTRSTLAHSGSSNDFGWGVAYILNSSTMSSNGGVASGTAGSKFAFGNTTSMLVTGSATSAINGRVDLRGDFNTNTNFTVEQGSTLNVNASITSSVLTTGQTGFTKLGGGTMVLSASNSYTGTTFVNGGTLRAAANNALGAGTSQVVINGGTLLVDSGISVPNAVTLAGGSYARTFSGSLAGALNSTSDIGGIDTNAQLRGGILTGTASLTSSFSATSTAINDHARRSDVYHFAGTGTDTFVLQLSIETGFEEGSYLVWLDDDPGSSTYNQWVNAVEGNTGGIPVFVLGAYNPATDFQLGRYGVDLDNGVVWAVLNHNSAFSIVPEPGVMSLVILGLAGCMRRRRAGRRES